MYFNQTADARAENIKPLQVFPCQNRGKTFWQIFQGKYMKFTNIYDKEKHQVFTSKKLEPATVWRFN